MSFVSKLRTKLEETKTAVVNSVELVDKDVSTARMQICLECPHLTKPLEQCDQCGCFMRAKTKLKIATCPLKKW